MLTKVSILDAHILVFEKEKFRLGLDSQNSSKQPSRDGLRKQPAFQNFRNLCLNRIQNRSPIEQIYDLIVGNGILEKPESIKMKTQTY